MLSEDATLIAKNRYFASEDETWETCCRRIARFVASAEPAEKRAIWEEKFAQMIYELRFIPGGRILRNSGKVKGSVLNCYVLPVEDDIISIGDLIKNSLIVWAEGGGCGINFSPLRPSGAPIKTKGGESSGLVSFLQAVDGVANTIESGGQRRAAAIAIVRIDHPEVLKFIDAKLKHGTLSNFNISVALTEEFLTAVERGNGTKWDFNFGGKTWDSTIATDLWNKIVDNMLKSAEPGIINWKNLTKNNSYYFNQIVGTNPCGELPLGEYEACDLGSINLPSFVKQKNTDMSKLAETIDIAIRFLDNIIDVNYYSISEIENKVKLGRRIGLGTMGLADYLFKKELRYGGQRSLSEIERLYKFIRDKAYESSIRLALEKGTFPKFDKIMFGKASFIRKLPASLRSEIKKHGIRNVTILTQPPTGTTSLLAGATSGIEPLFCKAYRRKDRISERIYIHPFIKSLKDGEDIPEWFVDVFDLTPVDHFEVQSVIQRFTDGAVSKTINLPKSTTLDDLSKLLLEYIWDLKGVTVYRDNSRDQQVLYPMSKSDIKKHLKSGSSSMSEEDMRCASGTCEI